MASATDTVSEAAATVLNDAVAKQGPFVLGFVIGCAITGVLSYFINKLASKERREQMALDVKRFEVVMEQNAQAGRRITELHEKLGQALEKGGTKHAQSQQRK
jgi:hypothetical protein